MPTATRGHLTGALTTQGVDRSSDEEDASGGTLERPLLISPEVALAPTLSRCFFVAKVLPRH